MKITRMLPKALPELFVLKKVAAYARVSVETERMHHSLSEQVSYFSELIQSNPAWEYVGVYCDEGISGTKTDSRKEFQRMIADAEAGKIDIILTKSISRFARNTVDLLKTVRYLRSINVEVRFERENINTLSTEGEFWITVLAAFAEAESDTTSTNIKWALRKRFSQGIPSGAGIYGYRREGSDYKVVPEEAAIVKLIFENYLNGISAERTAAQRNEQGVRSYTGGDFSPCSIRDMLSNITYTGDLLLQKEYVTDDLLRKKVKNNGEVPRFYVKNNHEPIIDRATFDKVQERIVQRREELVFRKPDIPIYPFTQKMVCGICGSTYWRSVRPRTRAVTWICRKRSKNADDCRGRIIPEYDLRRVVGEIFGEWTEDDVREQIDQITVIGEDKLSFKMADGRVIEKTWKPMSRHKKWTPERTKNNSRKRGFSIFSGMVICGKCGGTYHNRKKRAVNYWRCSNARYGCSGKNVYTDFLNAITEGYLEELDLTDISRILKYDDCLIFEYNDGRREKVTWKEL